MTDQELRGLIAKWLIQAAADGDFELIKLLTPAARGDQAALDTIRSVVAPVGTDDHSQS